MSVKIIFKSDKNFIIKIAHCVLWFDITQQTIGCGQIIKFFWTFFIIFMESPRSYNCTLFSPFT